MARGSGLFNLQAGGHMTRNRRQSNAEDARAEAELRKWMDQSLGYQQPYYDYGQNALRDFEAWGSDPNAITSDPSYKWRLSQGLEGVENSAAARGGALSGNALRAITDYGQGAASNEYQNEFQRWLAKLGIGQGAAANMSNISMNAGNALSGRIAQGGENSWNRLMGQHATTIAGEQALNNIIQSWVPSSAGGGNPGQTVQTGGGGGGSGSSDWMNTSQNFGAQYSGGGYGGGYF